MFVTQDLFSKFRI